MSEEKELPNIVSVESPNFVGEFNPYPGEVGIITYNLLSTELADPDYHSRNEPLHLSTEYRWHKMLATMQTKWLPWEMILCLQELTPTWITLLLPIFLAWDYHFVYDSQWLGVGIAFPKCYHLQQMEMVCLGDWLKKQSVPRLPLPQPAWPVRMYRKLPWTWAQRILPTILYQGIAPKWEPMEDDWTRAMKRANRCIHIRLQIGTLGPIFGVTTYHMPCEFTRPSLMNIHTAALWKSARNFHKERPYLLVGDFNQTPDTEAYKLLTTSKMPTIPEHSSFFSTLPSLFVMAYPLQSAYKTKLGKEPTRTNYSHAGKAQSPFDGTLDYIFSSQATLCGVLPLPDQIAKPNSFWPNERHPSDHLPLGAWFRL